MGMASSPSERLRGKVIPSSNPSARITSSIFSNVQNLTDVSPCGKLMAKHSISFHYLSLIRETDRVKFR